MFPRIKNLGGGSFGEDADIFGDTLREVVQDAPQTHDLPFKQQTVNELRNFLTYSDEDIERISWVVLGIDPTVDVEEPPNWGSFPTLRAFWSAVLHAFENDPEVQMGREIDPSM
ncbi:contact-dependent growth inhibition system immunity protein [Acetobacter pasteurianus]